MTIETITIGSIICIYLLGIFITECIIRYAVGRYGDQPDEDKFKIRVLWPLVLAMFVLVNLAERMIHITCCLIIFVKKYNPFNCIFNYFENLGKSHGEKNGN